MRVRNQATHALFLAAALLAVCTSNLPAQIPTTFDKVQITPANANVPRLLEVNGDNIAAASITLVDLLTYAYRIGPDDIRGLTREQRTTRFDVVGTIDVLEKPDPKHSLRTSSSQPLIDALLQNHFRMAIRESQDPEKLQELIVAFGGARLHPSPPDCACPNSTIVTGNHLHSASMSMRELAQFLAHQLQISVEDKTKLQGTFAIDLDWSPIPNVYGPLEARVRKALQQQLGLSLRTSSTEARAIVIDYVEFPESMTGVPPTPDSAKSTPSPR